MRVMRRIAVLAGVSAAAALGTADALAASSPLVQAAGVVSEQPTVTSVQPDYASTSGGTEVSITGDYLENVRSVHFGTVEGTNVEEECGGLCELFPYTTLTVHSPAHHSGSVDVTVTTSTGTSAINDGDQFAYVKATSSKLILTAAGGYAPDGTPASGVLRFGACGTLQSSGTLTVNDRHTDQAALASVEKEGGGGCGEGGANAAGQISRMTLSAAGVMTVIGEVTYTTELPEHCVYELRKLNGTLAIPGPTESTVSGVGARTAGSAAGCARTLHVENGEAALENRSTGETFQAEL